MILKLKKEVAELNLETGWAAELYHTYVTNLHRVYPDRDFECLQASFRNTLFYQRLASIQQRSSDYKNNALAEQIKAIPSVILTAHIYSYRLLVRCLSENGVKIALLVSADVYLEQGAVFESVMRDIHGDRFAEHFILLDAEQPSVLLQARRAFDRGYHILAYLDGNTGTALNDKSADHLHTVDFGAARLRVRKGIVQLAQWLACPLYFIWAHMDADLQAYFNIKDVDTQKETHEIVAQLYSDLYDIINDDPAQWECFLYLQDYI
ncbi:MULTISPECIES: hypothetical protein [Sphingobacterium]|uniref:hypothetical protein n=1 Tax=Sphingobacterium TaxID=28453 RepID=UPI0013DA6EB9|nr:MULTISPECIES: hypothetical protein [unclassified Sphingobacterium]